MAATTLDRMTLSKFIERTMTYNLKSGVTIPHNVLVMVNTPSTGLDNAADVAGGVVVGVSDQRVSTASGDTKGLVRRGVHKFANGGHIVDASRGQLACVVDNQTVDLAANTTNAIGAGYIEEVESDGVWISMLGGKIAAA